MYEKTGNAKGLERERRVIPVLEKWLEENRKRNEIALQSHPRRPRHTPQDRSRAASCASPLWHSGRGPG